MNQPPGGGYPPGQQYPGQPGFPQQGYPQQQQQQQPQAQPQVGQPGAAKPFMGTALMPGAPPIPGAMNPVQAAQAQAAAAAQQAQQYGGAPQQPYGAPQQQGYPGAPPQHEQRGLVPNIGIGGFGPGGMPRLDFSGGMSRGNLIAAVIGGQGFAKPRLTGLGMIGLSFAFGVANTVLVLVLHRYYMYLYSAGAIFGWAGTWMVLTGQPRAQADGSKAPAWGRAGLMVCFVIGTLVGIALSIFNWEHMLFNAAADQVNGN